MSETMPNLQRGDWVLDGRQGVNIVLKTWARLGVVKSYWIETTVGPIQLSVKTAQEIRTVDGQRWVREP